MQLVGIVGWNNLHSRFQHEIHLSSGWDSLDAIPMVNIYHPNIVVSTPHRHTVTSVAGERVLKSLLQH
jgi:hypothetical protein